MFLALFAFSITRTASAKALDLSKWTDCGDASTRGKVSDLQPQSLPLGQKTTVTATSNVDEVVSAGTFAIALAAGPVKETYTGDICTSKVFKLPLNTGSITWDGLKCPLAVGNLKVPVDLLLSSLIPAALETGSIHISLSSSSGDKLACVNIPFSPSSAAALALSRIGATDVHEERRAQIEEIQNTPGVLWTAAPQDRFASEAPGASKHMMGVKGDWKASIEAAIARGKIERFQELTAMEVPANFDSETNWPKCAKIIGDIRDQSNCGCCWAFGAAEAASDRMCIASDATLMLPLSAQDVCFTSSDDGCDGGDINSPWDYISETGVVTGGQYEGTGPFGKGLCLDFSLPHCHHHGPQGKDPYPAEGAPGCPHEQSPDTPKKCDADAEAPHNEFKSDKYTFSGQTQSAQGPSQIKQAIMTGGPVETAFTVYSDFENYAGGIYHHVSGSMAGGHAVKIVGWGVESGTKYWKVANSWNPYWGEKGYFRIKEGEGGIDDQVTFSPAKAKWSKKGDNTIVV